MRPYFKVITACFFKITRKYDWKDEHEAHF